MNPASSITSVGLHASPTGSSGNCEVIIGSYSFGENGCVICSELNIKVLILEGKDRFVPALPLLEFAVLITVEHIYSTSSAF